MQRAAQPPLRKGRPKSKGALQGGGLRAPSSARVCVVCAPTAPMLPQPLPPPPPPQPIMLTMHTTTHRWAGCSPYTLVLSLRRLSQMHLDPSGKLMRL